MSFESAKHVLKYLLASILVGVILGISGAFAAQGFRTLDFRNASWEVQTLEAERL